MISNSGILFNLQYYTGLEQLLVGDGNDLQIKHIGPVMLATLTSESLLLKIVLYVPHIKKNLLSISKLLTDNNVVIEFVDNFYYIKATNSGITLVKGIAKKGLYQIQGISASSQCLVYDTSAFITQPVFNKQVSLFSIVSNCSKSDCSTSVVFNHLSALNNESCIPAAMTASLV